MRHGYYLLPKWHQTIGNVMNRKKHYHSISDIVAAVYCEQKLIFDRDLGDASPLPIRKKAAEGTLEHQRFAMEGQRAAIDKRCFIASSIYGIDSIEAVTLRKWRDDVLLQSKMGCLFVYGYYRLSPCMVSVMAHQTWLVSLVRAGLDWWLAVLDKKVNK